MAQLVITIDGPAGSGKSTIARLLAERIGASFLDTGAMYRAVTLAAMQAQADLADRQQLLKVLDETQFRFEPRQGGMAVYVNGVYVAEQIRDPAVTSNAKHIASAPLVREKLVALQRQFAAGQDKIVTEGRDQGTVAFPDAAFKFYLTASLDERARRRCEELKTRGVSQSLAEIRLAIEQRDKSDTSRDVGPLRPAKDAIIVDTTRLSIEQVVEALFAHLRRKCPENP